MTRLGADPEQLERVAQQLRGAADRLTSMGTGVGARLRREPWHGPDAETFRSRWRHHLAPALRRGAEDCRRAARDLDRHAAEQRRAAAGTPTRVAGRRAARTGAPPHLPRHIEVIGARLDGGYLLGAGGLGATATVEQLGGGRLRVTVADARAAGLQVGGGRSVGVTTPTGGPVSGGSAAVGARLESVDSRTWTIDRHHLPLLLALAGLQQGLGRTPVGSAVTDAARLLGVAPGAGPLPGPHPDRSERLRGVGLTAALAAGGGTGPSIAAGGAMSLLAGSAEGAGGTSVVVQWNESGELLLGRRLAAAVGLQAPAARAELAGRIEVPTGPGAGRRPVEVALETTTGDLRTVRRTWVDPAEAPRLATALRRSTELLAAGDVAGAERQLAGTTTAVAAAGTTVDHFRVGRSGLALPVTGGAASATPSIQRLHLRRTGG